VLINLFSGTIRKAKKLNEPQYINGCLNIDGLHKEMLTRKRGYPKK
jgi:hypothetical protein